MSESALTPTTLDTDANINNPLIYPPSENPGGKFIALDAPKTYSSNGSVLIPEGGSGGGMVTIVPNRRDHSVNGGAVDNFTSGFPAPILRQNTTVNLAGGYNGGGIGNKAIMGHWLPAPMPLSALESVELDFEQLTPEAGAIGDTLPYMNLIVEFDPVGFPGVLCVLSFGDISNITLNLGTYSIIGPNQHRTIWTPGANFIQIVNNKGVGGGAPHPPTPLFGPPQIPVSQGPPFPGIWNNNDYSIANILVAYPNALIVNGSSGDGGLPKNTQTAGLMAIIGDSGSVLQNQVRILAWALNGVSI